MRVWVGSDHAGFAMKELLKEHLVARGDEVTDVGTDTEDSVDYPDYAEAVARAVAAGDAERGILVCGSGLGMAMAANKIDGVRAAAVTDPELARMSRMHNDANVIALGGRYISSDVAERITDAFLDTAFEGGRHDGRIAKIAALERRD